jgi:excisionase family DNA binding protein
MKDNAPSDPGGEPATVDAQTHEVMTKAELADYLRISRRTVDDWMREGKLPYWKIGRAVRFKRKDVVEHLDRTCSR